MEFKNRSVKNFDSVYQQIIKERQRALRKAFRTQNPDKFEKSTINSLLDSDKTDKKGFDDKNQSELLLISQE